MERDNRPELAKASEQSHAEEDQGGLRPGSAERGRPIGVGGFEASVPQRTPEIQTPVLAGESQRIYQSVSQRIPPRAFDGHNRRDDCAGLAAVDKWSVLAGAPKATHGSAFLIAYPICARVRSCLTSTTP